MVAVVAQVSDTGNNVLGPLTRLYNNLNRKAVSDIADLTAVTIHSISDEAGPSAGSGVIIAPHLVLTAAHVLSDNPDYPHTVMHRPSGVRTAVVDKYIHWPHDLAVVEIADHIPAPLVKFGQQRSLLWQGIYCADVKTSYDEMPPERPPLHGYTMGKNGDSALFPHFRLGANFGNSGGAIFNADTNEIISIMQRASLRQDGTPIDFVTVGVAAKDVNKVARQALQHFALERA
ncbi:MAG: hypothetical protein GC136_03690 [Alphaproteobacteria bacterium]|nr:hypothetical protein [Alphaproteobacteria bacterium]